MGISIVEIWYGHQYCGDLVWASVLWRFGMGISTVEIWADIFSFTSLLFCNNNVMMGNFYVALFSELHKCRYACF